MLNYQSYPVVTGKSPICYVCKYSEIEGLNAKLTGRGFCNLTPETIPCRDLRASSRIRSLGGCLRQGTAFGGESFAEGISCRSKSS